MVEEANYIKDILLGLQWIGLKLYNAVNTLDESAQKQELLNYLSECAYWDSLNSLSTIKKARDVIHASLLQYPLNPEIKHWAKRMSIAMNGLLLAINQNKTV